MSQWTLFLFLIGAVLAQKKCPPMETILPCRCLIKGEDYQIWCSHSDLPKVLDGLKSLKTLITNPIDELILENNYLPSLPGRTFNGLKVLRLMLRNNGLERVSSDFLMGLEKSIMELFIVEPDLRSLPDDSLTQLYNLQAVTIQTNLIKRYPFFSHLPKLKYLQLESLSLLELSSRSFRNLPSLETLHISNSPRLSKLEANFLQDLPKLSTVNISYCGINWMHPRAITNLAKLKELSLIGNKITDAAMIGRGIRDLPELEILMLDHNYIDNIPEATFVDLPALKKLHLSNNNIRELQYGAFHRVPALRSLDLNKNALRRVHPESFLQQSSSGLEELSLVDNDISHVIELRSLLNALPRLQFLDLSYNNLEEIPFGVLRGHATLERLHLDYNKIRMIENEAFMAMPALRELRLRNNSLSDDLGGPFWNLPALKGLDLSGNFYQRIESHLLANLPSLRRVDFSANDINFVHPEAFLLTPSLEHINFSYNALTSLHPATFRPLLNLYELDVAFNFLIEFVPNLPRGLEYLHMGHNKISAIPTQPSPDLDLPSLRMLDVSFNEIQRIPSNALRTLPQLRRLFLGKNLLQKLEEDSLSGITRLETLNLEANKIGQIHRNAFRQKPELKELVLKNNRLDIIFGDVFKETPRLRKLDLSYNKLAEVVEGLWLSNDELEVVDMSNNFLLQLPLNFRGKKKLKILNLNNNRLKQLDVETLSSLTNLKELKLSDNYIQELKMGSFENLQHLKSINFENNEVEVIEANAVRALPALKSLRLSRNKITEIPNFAFNNLPNLQVAELQDNQIRIVGSQAFNLVPHLLVLNLSHNHLAALEDAGLRSLKSLEMLDISKNKIRSINSNLDKMEWLVEFRINDNRICAVHGVPFDDMPRLRVLNLRNNQLVSLPEQAVQKLKSNIAVLDLEGNPLSCSCNLLWFQAWLQENSSMGPKCVDGTLLRDIRLSRQDCSLEERNAELVAPGCENEALSTSQVLNIKANKNHLGPEESEYFYDEYIDYPFNDTQDRLPTKNIQAETTISPHMVPGDTPTIYAATKNKTKNDVPKEVSNSPSTSGFTFFGVPLPNLNLKNLLGAGRMDGIKTPIADRKTAIVNKPSRTGARGGFNLPTNPEIQMGGFVPLLPGLGGFEPIPDPMNHFVNSTTMTSELLVQNKSVVNEEVVAKIEEVYSVSNVTPVLIVPEEENVTDVVSTTTEIIVVEVPEESTTEVPTTPLSVVASTEQAMLETQTSFGTSTESLVTEAQKMVGSPLSALLVPSSQSSGRSTITKVQSPNRVSGSAPLLSNFKAVEDIQEERESKASKIYAENALVSTEDTSWYFANYNMTNLEPFVGISQNRGSSGCSLVYLLDINFVLILGIFVNKVL